MQRTVSRRHLLQIGGGLAVAGVAVACGRPGREGAGAEIGPTAAQVTQYAVTQRGRYPQGRTLDYALTAAAGTLDIGGKLSQAWTYNGQLPGPILRGSVGDRLRVQVHNGLPESTTIHWHGLAVPNDMDGVPGVTQPPIGAGGDFRYEFVLPQPGTYWYHTHAELQRGRGLYGALLVDDPTEAGDYDVEFTVLLSDWLLDGTPSGVFSALKHGGRSSPMPPSGIPVPSQPPAATGEVPSMGAMFSPLLGGDAGDVRYSVYLLNGRQPGAPVTLTAKPGQRARIRVINAADDTVFRVALGGHRITVTHSDGWPVIPVEGDALLIGMGERYDLRITLADGVFPLVADAEGKDGRAFGMVRTATGVAPAATATPPQLAGRVLTVTDLSAAPSVRLPATSIDTSLSGALGGDMARYEWTINGRMYPDDQPLVVRPGKRVQLTLTNSKTMYHPMHLHGHTFAVARPDGAGPRKDTIIVLPGQSMALDFDTDNPGQWITHCHNDYHLAAGMATVVSYHT
ncbi:multicopper oxidase family protein [Mycobacterium avium]|uniref:Multicopper oxidase family protein n=2 Tax=Mycobacterium avium TaxID=1764 RepID=A0A3B6XFK0_MYCAV|nr:multicopper oxidase family protein [Mycobacterium avium]APT13654.1 copper oxidase [Mycobacterium avium subsp. hominissuis]AXO25673.1 multicopper oxidase family protein [Mycobacterium avium subsp. hominissuis]ETZ43433.1 multicopper oxidase family protein [Mycobacterium avium MAV_120809_2495]MCA2338144.1 multicopper oxidase family protein [Mycobacterium avium]MDO2361161.1 multicopper oxidase family protein [Mycobacterium avium subsp. hominissuis]